MSQSPIMYGSDAVPSPELTPVEEISPRKPALPSIRIGECDSYVILTGTEGLEGASSDSCRFNNITVVIRLEARTIIKKRLTGIFDLLFGEGNEGIVLSIIAIPFPPRSE